MANKSEIPSWAWAAGGIALLVYLCRQGLVNWKLCDIRMPDVGNPFDWDPAGSFGYTIFGQGGQEMQAQGKGLIATASCNVLNVYPPPPYSEADPAVSQYISGINPGENVGTIQRTYQASNGRQFVKIKRPQGGSVWISYFPECFELN